MIRILLIATIVMFLYPCGATAEPEKITLRLIGVSDSQKFSLETKKTLVIEIEQLILSSNFDSANHPNFPSMVASEEDWDSLCRPRCLEIGYAEPKLFKTIGGPVTLSAFRISKWKVIGRNGPKVIRLGKWNGALHMQILEASKLERS